MQINGDSAKQTPFNSRSTNQRSDKAETTLYQNGDTYVIRDRWVIRRRKSLS